MNQASPAAMTEETSTAEHLRGFLTATRDLAKCEIELTKRDLRKEVEYAKKSLAAIVMAAATGALSALWLLTALTMLLAKFMPTWMATGIVGAGLLLCGLALGIFQIKSDSPDGTKEVKRRLAADAQAYGGD